MNKYTEYEPTVRCCGITREKKRCIKDASYEHAGKAYCNRHYQKVLQERQNAKKTVG